MNDNWSLLNEISLDTSTVAAGSITAGCFDPLEELLWVGTDQGRVCSLHNQNGLLNRYSSFWAHHGPIAQLLVGDQGVYSVGPNALRFSLRSGIHKWVFKHEKIQQGYAVSFTNNASEILFSAHKRQLFVVNKYKGSLIKQIDIDDDILVMKKSNRYICSGTSRGRVNLRDPRSYRVEHSFPAHTYSITNIDVNGNYIATCGFSQNGDHLFVDPIVKVYDIRYNSLLQSINFPSGASFLKFHPFDPSYLFICSQLGELQIVNIHQSTQNIKYCETSTVAGAFTTSMTLSTSGDLMAITDNLGIVHEWTHTNYPLCNNNSLETEIPAPAVLYSDTHIDEYAPLNTLGMPYYTSKLLSIWPASYRFVVGRPSPKIPQDILDEAKVNDFVGYAQNNGRYQRNQDLYRSVIERKNAQQGPKFRSEQQRERFYNDRYTKSRNASIEDMEGSHELSHPSSPSKKKGLHSTEVPAHYKRVEIKYSRFGVEDFDFEFYNQSQYGGLETHIQHSYCNAMLQVLFFTPTFRDICKDHINQSCPKEFCLTCELGFLFRILEDSQGVNCQATNFLRAFGHVHHAHALGLFEPDTHTPTVSYASLIQNFSRFIFEQVHQEISAVSIYREKPFIVNKSNNGKLSNTIDDKSTEGGLYNGSIVQRTFGIPISHYTVCGVCQNESIRHMVVFTIDLVYGNKSIVTGVKPVARTNVLFTEILEQSIHKESSAKTWCSSCTKYQTTNMSRKLNELPEQLMINANVIVDEDLQIWKEGGQSKQQPWLPKLIFLKLDQNGVLVAKDNDEDIQDYSEYVPYELKSLVDEVRDQADSKTHLVAHIQVDNQSDSWYIFNDFLVQPAADENIALNPPWRFPAVIQYVRVYSKNEPISQKSSLLNDPNMMYKTISRSFYFNRRKDLRNLAKPLKSSEVGDLKGYLCAIDAEFVALTKEESEIRSDGTRSVVRPSRLSLARVSVLRGSGSEAGVPFIDEYISTTDHIVDYLTEFSGIKAGDLDPKLSTHPLVSLKSSYKKLRTLVDAGCIFIGHGLKKDFRIINILVPPNQIIDTVDLYFLKHRQRRLSLKFLSWILLKQDIQQDTHDSIEDAKTALLLYNKYVQLSKEGKFESTLEHIYEEGKIYNYRPPNMSTSNSTSSLNAIGNSNNTINTPGNSNINIHSPPRRSRTPTTSSTMNMMNPYLGSASQMYHGLSQATQSMSSSHHLPQSSSTSSLSNLTRSPRQSPRSPSKHGSSSSSHQKSENGRSRSPNHHRFMKKSS